uniref:NADH-ubiquinone oxidoreductase chain 5 n=1 Tax=Liposcelis sculptilimacula TaxID=1899352 RepID=A0A191ZS68_9NEOP|nr:NADH dehydrogenase subunit 5 [Liposcelis keleri]ANJ70944.1 NADH dehydrogenase subunit 5 [Liposcelis sculptilimacula]
MNMITMIKIMIYLFYLFFVLFNVFISLNIFNKIVFVEISFLDMLSSHEWMWVILVDQFSMIFSCVVLWISFFILIYSLSYMTLDLEKTKFYSYLLLFIFSMLILIYSFNISSILLGWDGLGISSFLLIMFYNSVKSINSSLITILVNRIGDLFIIFYFSFSFIHSSWNIMFSFSEDYMIVLLLLAAASKSAQIPFSSWLPKAMAAPTPVSSLVHSSTLVTAGVYLIFRLPSSIWLMWKDSFFLISSLTMIMSSILALWSFDFKEVIAFSTMSHMSFMMMTLFNGSPLLMFFHLCAHALFKALMFMCSGFLIYFFLGCQDIRKLNLFFINAKIKFSFYISLISMSGLPFLTGFFSKEIIINSAINKTNYLYLYLMTIILTSAYSFRLFLFLSTSKSYSLTSNNEILMSTSIFISSCSSVFFGALYQWFFIPLSSISNSSEIKLLILTFLILGIMISLFQIKIFTFNFLNLFNSLLNLYNFKFFILSKNLFFLIFEKGWLMKKINFFLIFENYSHFVFMNYPKIMWAIIFMTFITKS